MVCPGTSCPACIHLVCMLPMQTMSPVNTVSPLLSSAPFTLWVTIPYTIFLVILVPVYWVYLGPQNFLWACDIALFMTLYALWRRSALVASMAVLVTLMPDILWVADYVARAVSGSDFLGIGATAYMFEKSVPFFVRALSFFHFFLAPLLVWMIYHIGYDVRALRWQTGVAWIVLPVSYFFTDPVRNINWVHGFAGIPPAWMPPVVFVLLIMLAVPVLIFWPTHWLMQRLFFGANTFKRA